MTNEKISVLIPVGQRVSDIDELYTGYRQTLDGTARPYEVIFVLDGPMPEVSSALDALQQRGEPVTVIRLTRAFGEATALMVAFERCSGDTILTLPAYHQIEPAGIVTLLDGLADADMTTAHRWPRAGAGLDRARRTVFHAMLRRVTGSSFRDLGCNARAMRRIVLEEVTLYGDQHRFLPVLATRQGFRVAELDVPQSPKDINTQGYRLRDYLHRSLDIFTVFFLVRFTKKPLRFFGMVGATTFAVGAVLLLYIVIERLVFGVALAERPALLLSSLLAVLGLQLFALGLLGELMIFTHARDVKEYQVAEVVQMKGKDADGQAPLAPANSAPGSSG